MHTRRETLNGAERLHSLEVVELGDASAQMLRWLEHRDGTGGDLDRVARARIPRDSRLPFANLEGPETPDLDILAFRHRQLHGV